MLVLIPSIMFAFPGGHAGLTSILSAGCGTCHGSSQPATTTTVSLEGGPRKVETESTTTFTIVVAHATMPEAGVGIAIRTTQTGAIDIGTLGVIIGTGMNVTGAEITHSYPKTMSGGSAHFTFTWKAPPAPGTYYVQAVGNAVNGNGRNDVADSWNWLQPVAITVEPATSVAEDFTAIAYTFPNPCTSGGVLTLGLGISGPVNVQFIDIAGNVVHAVTAQSSGVGLPLEVPALPAGTYAVVVTDGVRLRRTMIVVE